MVREVICTHVHGVEGRHFRYKCELLVTLPYFLFSVCGRHFKMDIFWNFASSFSRKNLFFPDLIFFFFFFILEEVVCGRTEQWQLLGVRSELGQVWSLPSPWANRERCQGGLVLFRHTAVWLHFTFFFFLSYYNTNSTPSFSGPGCFWGIYSLLGSFTDFSPD